MERRAMYGRACHDYRSGLLKGRSILLKLHLRHCSVSGLLPYPTVEQSPKQHYSISSLPFTEKKCFQVRHFLKATPTGRAAPKKMRL